MKFRIYLIRTLLGGVFNTELEGTAEPEVTSEFTMGVRPNPLAPQIAVPLTPDPSTFSPRAAAVATKVERTGTLTAEDLRGLTPNEVNAVVGRQIQLNSLSQELEETLGTTAGRLETSRLRQAELGAATDAKRREALFKAKADGAAAIAASNLSEADKRTRITKLIQDDDLESVLTQSVDATGLTKATNYGAEREALSRELWNKPYNELTQQQQAAVNLELPARTAPSLEVVRDETGAYVIDKQNGTATKINPSGSASRLRRSGPQDDPATVRQLPLSDGSSISVTPDRRTTDGKRSASLSALNSSSDLTTGLRNMGQEEAENLYNEVIVPRGSAKGTQVFRDALIRAYPSLKDKYSATTESPRGAIEPLRQSAIDLSDARPEVLGSAGVPTYTEPARPFLSTPPKEPREPKLPTQDAAEARMYGTRMQEANNNIERLEASGEFANAPGIAETISRLDPKLVAVVTGGIGAFIGALGTRSSTGAAAGAGVGTAVGAGASAAAKEFANSWRTPRERQYIAEKARFILAVLRDESGSAIGTDEFRRQESAFFPERGDDAWTIRRKAEARRQMLRELEVKSNSKWLEDKYKRPLPTK
jgi:hypothetical protein